MQWARIANCEPGPRCMSRVRGKREGGQCPKPDAVSKRLKTEGTAGPPKMELRRGCKSKIAPPHQLRDTPVLRKANESVGVEVISTLLDSELPRLSKGHHAKRRIGLRKSLRLH